MTTTSDVTKNSSGMRMRRTNHFRSARDCEVKEANQTTENVTRFDGREMCSCVVLVFLALVARSHGYNVDTTNPIIRQAGFSGGKTGFGVAVAIHRKNDGERCLLVGSPKMGTEGMVYECNITDAALGCQQFEGFEKSLLVLRLTSDYNTSGMLFGQTIVSTQGRLLACGPRTQFNGTLQRDAVNLVSWYPTGVCTVNDKRTLYEPLKQIVLETLKTGTDRNVEAGRYLISEFGFSADIGDNGEVVVGSPLSFLNRGSGFITDFDENLASKGNSDGANTTQPNPEFGSAYRGFSVAVGNFFSSVTVTYALGKPKQNDFKGIVTVAERSATVLRGIADVHGNEVGSMFGYSVAAVNLNGDNFTDLVVGAPFHGGSSKDDVNLGQIFVYLTDGDRRILNFSASIEGKGSHHMFGLTLLSLGDLDLDGFEDFAVAAPFQIVENSESGVIYIFRGSPHGLRSETASQIITPTTSGQQLKTFGYSLAGKDDVDDNSYNDVLVGAEQSETIVLFRTHPIVVVNVSLSANTGSVSLEAETCANEKACFSLDVCLVYDVKKGAKSIPSLVVNYTLLLDNKKTSEDRLVKLNTTESQLDESIIMKIGEQQCFTNDIAVKDDIQDRLTQFDNIVTVTSVAFNSSHQGPLPDVEPILDKDVTSTAVRSVAISPDCIYTPCRPDLVIEVIKANTSSQVFAGSNDEVILQLRVTNKAVDGSYNTKLSITVDPPKLAFINEVLLCGNKDCDPSFRCEPLEGTMQCDTGNPLRNRDSDVVTLTLNMLESGLLGSEEAVFIRINASSIGRENETTSMNNFDETRIAVVANTSLTFTGASVFQKTVGVDELSQLVSGAARSSDLSKPFTHEYNWKNDGPSLIPAWKVDLWWPTLGTENMPNFTVSRRSKGSQIPVREECSKRPDLNMPSFCSGIGCIHIECTVNDTVEKGDSLAFTVTTTVDLNFLFEYVSESQGEISNPVLTIRSRAIASVSASYAIDSVPAGGEVPTDITFLIEFLECVPVWILIVSVIGALVLLAVAVVILYVLGFFKQRHKGIKLKKSRSGPAAGGPIQLEALRDDEQHTATYVPSSKRQSKSDGDDGDGGYENVKRQSQSENGRDGYGDGYGDGYEKRQSRSSTGQNEDTFKMAPQELQEEPPSYRKSRGSYGDGGGTAHEPDEKRRQSQSSHSQTTV